MSEKLTSQTNEQPKIWVTTDDINKTQSNTESSLQLTHINNVLKILDLSDSEEQVFEEILKNKGSKALKFLATKSKDEIISFLSKSKNEQFAEIEDRENVKDSTISIEKLELNNQIQKIKSTFTPSILNNNKDIADQLKLLDTSSDPTQKEKVFNEILNILKNPWRLKSIIDELGGADTNNPKYVEFKNNLIGLDSSFENYFTDLENLNFWTSLDTNNIITWIEKDSWWIIDIDLNSNTPVNKMSLIWSSYSFDEEIDKQALAEITADSTSQLTEVQNAYTILKGAYAPFDSFMYEIRENWGKQDLKAVIKNAVANFSQDIFSELWVMYEDMGIDWSMQVTQADISSFSDIENPSDLKAKIESTKDKFQKITAYIWKTKDQVEQKYKTEIKELVQRKSEAKEKQLEVLEFFKACGFDKLPKELTNRLIRDIQSWILVIPWLPLAKENIDLKNWNFWESGAFIDKDGWINIEAKRNLVSFMNKIISWNIDKPLSVEAIASWVSQADPVFLQNQFLEANIVGGMGWKYGNIIENLKKTI